MYVCMHAWMNSMVWYGMVWDVWQSLNLIGVENCQKDSKADQIRWCFWNFEWRIRPCGVFIAPWLAPGPCWAEPDKDKNQCCKMYDAWRFEGKLSLWFCRISVAYDTSYLKRSFQLCLWKAHGWKCWDRQRGKDRPELILPLQVFEVGIERRRPKKSSSNWSYCFCI